MIEMMMIALLGCVLMVAEKIDEPVVRAKISSAYTRFVGEIRIDVINTKQNETSKTAAKMKWAVIETNGKKSKLVKGFAKKYDAIGCLRAHEIVLKAKDKKE